MLIINHWAHPKTATHRKQTHHSKIQDHIVDETDSIEWNLNNVQWMGKLSRAQGCGTLNSNRENVVWLVRVNMYRSVNFIIMTSYILKCIKWLRHFICRTYRSVCESTTKNTTDKSQGVTYVAESYRLKYIMYWYKYSSRALGCETTTTTKKSRLILTNSVIQWLTQYTCR